MAIGCNKLSVGMPIKQFFMIFTSFVLFENPTKPIFQTGKYADLVTEPKVMNHRIYDAKKGSVYRDKFANRRKPEFIEIRKNFLVQ